LSKIKNKLFNKVDDIIKIIIKNIAAYFEKAVFSQLRTVGYKKPAYNLLKAENQFTLKKYNAFLSFN